MTRIPPLHLENFRSDDKDITLFIGSEKSCPLIIFNADAKSGKQVLKYIQNYSRINFNLLCVENLNWEHDLTPWPAPALFKNASPFTGGADEYLEKIIQKIIPKAEEILKVTPSHLGIAGYSLAGMFSLYSMYKCSKFDLVASVSGSLWFPDFKEFILSSIAEKDPIKLYISLGDHENRTKNQRLKQIQALTESIVEHYKILGVNTCFEMNAGNHFDEPELRCAKAIMALTELPED